MQLHYKLAKIDGAECPADKPLEAGKGIGHMVVLPDLVGDVSQGIDVIHSNRPIADQG